LNGSDINGLYVQEKHKSVFNILDKEQKIVIGHKFLDKSKKSEIPAFNELLEDKEFSKGDQLFTFDALMTQVETLNRINDNNNKYIAKVKGNQKKLLNKVIEVSKNIVPISIFKIEKTERKQHITRTIEVFYSESTNLILFDSNFSHIQTIIKITKDYVSQKTGQIKQKVEYSIANFKDNAEYFYDSINSHWRVVANNQTILV